MQPARAMVVSLLVAGALGACAVDGEEGALDPEEEVLEARLEVPPITRWEPGRVDPRVLYPKGIKHLFVLIRTGLDARTLYAVGVGSGKVLWIYELLEADEKNLMDALADGWDVAHMDESDDGGTAIIKKPPPPPDGPNGDGELTEQELVRVVDFAATQEAMIEELYQGY